MSPFAAAAAPSAVGGGESARTFRRPGWRERVSYYLGLPVMFVRMWMHNVDGILHVLDIIKFRPMRPGLLTADHPWVTGLDPMDGQPIWMKNVLFRSPRRDAASATRLVPEADEVIVGRVGRFMANLVSKSVAGPEIPWGPQRRLPHGINYLHGAVHSSAGILVFNDFKDAIYHFTDPAFRQDVRRFAREEHREILLVFRTREYDTAEFAFLVSFLRLTVPWFANSNGPRKHVLWGNPAPYPVVNIITGCWKRDTYRLKARPNAPDLMRPAIAAARYFQTGPYRGCRERARWPEKLLAVYTYLRIRARGARGGLFFVDRRKLETLSGRDPYADTPIASVFPLDADVAGSARGGRSELPAPLTAFAATTPQAIEDTAAGVRASR